MQMQTLEQSLLKTLLYFDLFHFAPTLVELERWLLQTDSPASLGAMQEILDKHPQVDSAEGFYFLRGRTDLVALRKQKYLWTDEKWKHAKPFLRLLAMMPHVRGVWISNSVGWSNASRNSDTDLMIVTTPGRIWTARFFTTFLMKLFRQRPGEQDHAKALCLSFYMTSDHMNLERYKIGADDIHFTFWVTQIYPLFDADGLYNQYQRQNSWAAQQFNTAPWLTPILQRRITLSALERGLKWMLECLPLERLLKTIQLRLLPKRLKTLAQAPDQHVVITDDLLKFHDNDNRKEKQDEWMKRQSLLNSSSAPSHS